MWGRVIFDLDSKWTTTTANEIDIDIDVNNEDAGISYTLPVMANGGGAFDISTALANIGEIWTTGIINTFDKTLFDVFEDFNGVPSDLGGSGRWNALVAKPLIACTGTKESVKTNLFVFSSGRKDDLTNCMAPAPNSLGFTFEAAANMMGVFLSVMNVKPHSTAADMYYWDMPFPINGEIGAFKNYTGGRDDLVKEGISTVTVDESRGYRIEDFVTFRRLDEQAQNQKDWRYCRDIVGIDFNVNYNYRILEETNLYGKTTVPDSATISTDVSKEVVKPKQWKGDVYKLFKDLSEVALIADPDFSKASLMVGISGENPKRFNTSFDYQRTATVRISSTTAGAGFYYGE